MTKKAIEIGEVLETGHAHKRVPCVLDLQKFLVTRALVQAESGGGKSWLLRRLAEQSYSYLPPIILDPEGEFASLREKDDYIIAAPTGADAVANASTASLLALRILETRVAAVIDIFEMSPDEQRVFVQRFFDALTNAPKKLWTPRLVILDEVQLFAQEGDKGQCATAVANASTRWRKRGFVLVGATQRIANVSKDVSAGLKNKFIGGTSQDIDIARAARELGIRDIHDATQSLRRLEPGQFFCYGPALSHDVRKIQVGAVETTHPETGKKRMKAAPPPSKKIKALLAQLADLPKEADAEAKTVAEMRGLLRKKDEEIAGLKRQAPQAPVIKQTKTRIKVVKVPTLKPTQVKRLGKIYKDIVYELRHHRQVMDGFFEPFIKATETIDKDLALAMEKQGSTLKAFADDGLRIGSVAPRPIVVDVPNAKAVLERGRHRQSPTSAETGAPADASAPLSKGERTLLTAIVQYNGVDLAQLLILTGYKETSRRTYLQRLSQRGFIREDGDNVIATPPGVVALGDFERMPTGSALRRYWLDKLSGGEKEILKLVCDSHPRPVTKTGAMEGTGYRETSLRTYLQRLSARKLVVVAREDINASTMLFD